MFKPEISPALIKEVTKTMKSGTYVKGPKLEQFEKSFTQYCNRRFGLGVNSGTSAIYLSLKALGVSKGDKILVPSHTFVGSITPIILLGAEPVFIDIDEYYTIDFSELKNLKLNDCYKGVIPVDLYGQTADNKNIEKFCKKNNMFFVEDACQAHGARLGGRMAGSFGEISCFSFFPTKNLSVLGEGGMLLTDSKNLCKKASVFRDQGRDYEQKNGKFDSTHISMNFRLGEINSAIGAVQLKKLNHRNILRQKIARVYDEELKEIVEIPKIRKNAEHVYHQYVIKVESKTRARFIKYLNHQRIQTGIHYPIAVHQQRAFKKYSTTLPNTEKTVKQIVSLPVHPNLTEKEVQYVVKKIKAFFR